MMEEWERGKRSYGCTRYCPGGGGGRLVPDTRRANETQVKQITVDAACESYDNRRINIFREKVFSR